MRRGVLALAALLAGLAAGLVAGYGLGRREPAPAAGPPPTVEVEELRGQLAEARARIAELEGELERLRGGAQDAGEQAVAAAATRVALAVYRALVGGHTGALSAWADDPAAVEVEVVRDDGTERQGSLADAGAVAELVAWLGTRAPAGDPPREYVPDAHAPDLARSYRNVILALQRGYLFVQLTPDWALAKLMALPDRPELD